jgi:UDP-N-acetylmuramyl pentapeptide phosphotransferase/UDP-N-acetylglucosamine-1-phosphate transferase
MVEIVLAAALAAVAAWLLCPVVIGAGLWDNPDEARKQHQAPTPSAGGLAAAAGFALALAALSLWPGARWADQLGGDEFQRTGLAVAAAFATLLVGLLDDLNNLDARPKLAILALIAILTAVFVARADVLPVGGAFVIRFGFLFGVLGSALWIFTLTNTVNFMDGANGLAMGSMAVGFTGLGVLGVIHGAPHVTVISACAVGGLLGLLAWNFPAGRVFAGDAGALFIGMLAATTGLLLVRDGGVSPIIPPLVFFPLLADVLLTLAYRVKHGRPMLQAHRDHLYQVGMRAGMSHARIAITYWIITAHCAALAIAASFGPRLAPPAVFAPQPGDVPAAQVAMTQALAWVAALAPVIALAVLAAVSMHVSNRVRRFALARGVDRRDGREG